MNNRSEIKNQEKEVSVSQVSTARETRKEHNMENTGMNNGKSMGQVLGEFAKWCKKMFKKSCESTFEVTKDGKELLKFPVLVLVICGIASLGGVLLLLVVGMFAGCKYRFIGLENSKVDLNDMCEKVSETCEDIKKEFQEKNNE